MNVEHYEFPPLLETVNNISLEVMFQILESKKYVHSKVPEWSDMIGNKIIERMRAIAPFFKYVVSTCVVQKVGAGLHSEAVSYWDSKTDGAVVVKYENDSLMCIATVIGVAI